jgi:hypothetical protein
MASPPSALRKALPFLAAAGIGAAIVLTASGAFAASKPAPPPPTPAELSKKAETLLAQSGFQFVPSNLTLITIDAIDLVPIVVGALNALSWAATQKGLGRSVLVPMQYLDGKDHSYGGNGLPTHVLAVMPQDALGLVQAGLYAEWR